MGAVACLGSTVLAGGAHWIARSADEGTTWSRAEVLGGADQVTCLAVSREPAADEVVLAATLGSGILRSSDRGRTFRPACFGLFSFEVQALAWGDGQVVLAGGADGIYRSPNAGRAWKLVFPTPEPVVGVSWLGTSPPNTAQGAVGCPADAVGVLESGRVLASSDDGRHWRTVGAIGLGGPMAAVLALADRSVLAAGTAGIARSTDGGRSWGPVASLPTLALGRAGPLVAAGTLTGIAESGDGGGCWSEPQAVPVADVRRLMLWQDRPIMAGTHAGLFLLDEQTGWTCLPGPDGPLTLLTARQDGEMVGSGPAVGLVAGTPVSGWRVLIPPPDGWMSAVAFGRDGEGWAASATGRALWSADSAGAAWVRRPSPFGRLAVTALLCTRPLVAAATYDELHGVTQLWRSADHGETWTPGPRVETPLPAAAALPRARAMVLGHRLLHPVPPDGRAAVLWTDAPGERLPGPLRAAAEVGTGLAALTTSGLWWRPTEARNWTALTRPADADQLLDLGAGSHGLVVLGTGGRAWCQRRSRGR